MARAAAVQFGSPAYNGGESIPRQQCMVRKIPDGKAGGAGSNRTSRTVTEAIFGDKRSGRDRREQQTSVTESRRTVSDRRKAGRGAQAAWWLERDYVESHHFVQKSSSSRPRKRDDTPTGE